MMHRCRLAIAVLAWVAVQASSAPIKVAVSNTISGSVVSQLNAAGFSASPVSTSDIESGGLLSGAFDVLLFGRTYYSAVSQALVDALVAFEAAGRGLVTEWDGYAALWSGYDSTYRFSTSNPQTHWLGGTVGAGQYLASATPIKKVADHAVMAGLPDEWSAGGGTEYSYTAEGYSSDDTKVVATFKGDGGPNFPAIEFPAVIVGKKHAVVGIAFDYQDNPTDANIVRLYTNAVQFAAEWEAESPVPEPGTFALLGLGGLAALRKRRR